MNINDLPKKPILVEAPVWKRIFAFFIDYIILNSLILFPFEALLNKVVPSAKDISSLINMITDSVGSTTSLIWITSIMGIIVLAYFTIFESKYAQTPGKMLMRIFAVTLKSDKSNLQTMTFWQAIQRSISTATIYVMPILFFIDVIYALFNNKRQRLFERLTHTQTLQVDFI